MKLDCLIVNPGSRSSVYQGLGSEFSAIEPPSLAAMFATYLRRKGCSVEIYDMPALATGPHFAALEIIERNATLNVMVVYGFQPSASTQNMGAAGDLCKHIKDMRPDAKILMTGTHPAALPARTLQEEAVDYVCDSEGPQTIYELLVWIKSQPRAYKESNVMYVPGLWYRVGDVFMHNPKGELLDDLDAEMPGGAWDLLPMDKYRAHNWHAFEHINERSPYVSIHTSLGCPYKCTFCCINAPFGKPSYRMWSPKTVGDEIELLVTKYGVRNIKFVDEMFVLNKAHVLGVCDEIIKRGLGDQINIWAYARVDTVKEEFLEPLSGAGFRWLALGIESASKHVRDGVEKGRFGVEEIIKTVRKVQATGINVIGNYIFGLPDDTHETMQDTLALALEANCEFANFYSAMAYPGSKLYSLAVEKGWKLPDKWIGYSQHSYETEPLPTATLTGAEVLRFRDQAFARYFSDPGYLRMVESKFGMPVVEHLKRMVAQPLPRRLLQTQSELH